MKHLFLRALVLAPLIPLLPGNLLATSARDVRAIWNRAVPGWSDGPVRYGLSAKERAEYRSLRTAAERSSFIARFWASRNPEPAEAWNRTEEDFWTRVAVAQDSFLWSTKQGWETDRGWVYITLGPPNEINRRGPNLESWLYRALPNPRAPGNLSYVFVRDPGQDYRLSGNSFLPARPGSRAGLSTTLSSSGSMLDAWGLSAAGISTGEYPALRGISGPTRSLLTQPAGPHMASLGAEILSVPPEGRVARDRELEMDRAFLLSQAIPPVLATTHVTSQEVYGNLLLRHRVDFLRSANGSIRVLVTLALPREDLQAAGFPAVPLILAGTLRAPDGQDVGFTFGGEKSADSDLDLQTISGDTNRLFQISGVAEPGDYRLGLEARAGSRAGRTETRILVPDLSHETLAMGGPILADRVSVLEAGSPPSDFDLGGFRVMPRLMPVYSIGEMLTFYFQTYGASVDDGSRTHLDFRYEVFRREHRSYRARGKPVALHDQASPHHAFSFPLRDWTPGDYLIVVTAEDRVRGEIAVSSTAFAVR